MMPFQHLQAVMPRQSVCLSDVCYDSVVLLGPLQDQTYSAFFVYNLVTNTLAQTIQVNCVSS